VYVSEQNFSETISKLPALVKNDIETYCVKDNNFTNKTFDYIKGALFNDDTDIQKLITENSRFRRNPGDNTVIEPRLGRFYPAILYNDERLLSADKMTPFRFINYENQDLVVDISHPLANYEISVSIERITADDYSLSSLREVPDRQIPALFTGPGMQLRHKQEATDFFSDAPYERNDNNDDAEFYYQARHTNHLDEIALSELSHLYSDIIPKNAVILDLMSSINSHLDEKLAPQKVIGLGLNKEELNANEMLDEVVVYDLNNNENLPFESNTFDVVLCNLSIEYLTAPNKIFNEVSRILKPHGRFVISFSNRWFPTKAARLWNNLHDFERIGVVIEYFIESTGFGAINTFTQRGLGRPITDRHNAVLSDPIYALWAEKI